MKKKKKKKKKVIHLLFVLKILSLLTIFVSFSLIEWRNIHVSICNYKSLNVFKESIPQFKQNSGTTTYSWISKKETRYIIRLLFGLSYLHDYKFEHSFLTLANRICSCELDFNQTSIFKYISLTLQMKQQPFWEACWTLK